MANLPKQIALKSKYNNNYLRNVNEDSQIRSFLQYSGENVLTPYTMYEVEQAKSNPSLVSIRCCYNNKYWVSKSVNKEMSWIVAEAKKTEEDKSKWNCTLFQPIYDTANKAFRFRHIYLGKNVCLARSDPPYANCLIAKLSTPDKDLCDLSSIIDWKTLFSIPKYVAFKSDNGQYLRLYYENHDYLQFSSSDIGDSRVAVETFTTKDGNVRFKSYKNGLFWRRSPNWIWADSSDTTTNNPDTLFTPIKVDKDVFALRSLGNNNFIKRLTTEGKTNCLNAASSTIDQTSRFQLMEPLISREIYNVNSRPSDSRIYDQTPIVLATQTASNGLKVPNTMGLNFKYIDEKSSTWTSSVSIKLGIETTLKSEIPFIVEGEIKASAEFSGSYEWGKTKTTSTTIESTYQVTVPPKTTVTVSLMATRGTSDVPFSYTQRDTLFNGETKIYQLDDGVYKGINNYNFKYETKSMPIKA